MIIDLQVHSRVGSPDSSLSTEEIVRECLEAKIDGVALTEHSSCSYSTRTFAEAGLILVPAREVACCGAHLLVLSPDEQMLQDLPRAVDPSDRIFLREDVACVWAHPAAIAGAGVYPIFVIDPQPITGILSAIEILNGRHLHFAEVVEAALSLAIDASLPGTAGSDAHRPGEVARCVTFIESSRADGNDGIVSAIRKGKVEPALNSAWSERWGYHYRESLRDFVR